LFRTWIGPVDDFRDQLGFDCQVFGEPPDFATANRDRDSILLALAARSEQVVPNWKIVDKMWDAYIRVDDVDAVYAEVQQRGAAICRANSIEPVRRMDRQPDAMALKSRQGL
jgi:hypothetical protein